MIPTFQVNCSQFYPAPMISFGDEGKSHQRRIQRGIDFCHPPQIKAPEAIARALFMEGFDVVEYERFLTEFFAK